jgi:hypothetical protein
VYVCVQVGGGLVERSGGRGARERAFIFPSGIKSYIHTHTHTHTFKRQLYKIATGQGGFPCPELHINGTKGGVNDKLPLGWGFEVVDVGHGYVCRRRVGGKAVCVCVCIIVCL